MGRPDTAIKQWLGVKRRFADLFNGVIFNGRQIIKEEDLTKIDTESNIIITDKTSKPTSIRRHRDIVMRWKSVDLVILAIESQQKVNYSMPVRNMLYDALTYTEQIQSLWNALSRDEQKQMNTSEIFSRFRKTDRIYPVITVVFYFGSETTWDGAVTLHNMFAEPESPEMQEILGKYIPDYKLNLLDISNIKDVKIFKSDLQIIFGMLKYRQNKDSLRNYVHTHRTYFESIDIETCQASEVLLGADDEFRKILQSNKKGGEVNMCKALDDIYKDGIREGEKRGEIRGEKRGIEHGETLRIISLICRKIAKHKSLEVIADELEEEVDTIKPIYDIAIESQPDYDCDKIYRQLTKV